MFSRITEAHTKRMAALGLAAAHEVIAGHGHPIPFLRKGSRDDLRAATGDDKVPALKLADGTVLTHSKEILAWVEGQQR
mgnify:CR=1 FL=1